VENAYELLRTPGQFIFDRAEGQIYYVPRRKEHLTRADVEMCSSWGGEHRRASWREPGSFRQRFSSLVG